MSNQSHQNTPSLKVDQNLEHGPDSKTVDKNSWSYQGDHLASQELHPELVSQNLADGEIASFEINQTPPQSKSDDYDGFEGVSLEVIAKNLHLMVQDGDPLLASQTGPNSPFYTFMMATKPN